MSLRILALTDLAPDQPDWKGAVAWRILHSLAEAHHEVMVATPLDPERVGFSHPRLQIVRPVRSWRADQLPKLAKLLALQRPQLLHVFGASPNRLWPALSVWPYLAALIQAARIPAFATLFEAEEGGKERPESAWLKGARRITVFGEEQRRDLPGELREKCEVLPLDLDSSARPAAQNAFLIPAPVDEWTSPEKNLAKLAEILRTHASFEARIVGGWGAWPASRRRSGWAALEGVQSRISLCEPLSFENLLTEIPKCSRIYMDPLSSRSWRHQMLSSLARASSESSANFLSRMYAR